MTPFLDPKIQARFDAYPTHVRPKMLALRELVLQVGAQCFAKTQAEIEETLKWSEPAYVTTNGAGSTVRIDWKPNNPKFCVVYFNCKTNLIDSFRQLFPNDFQFEGNRAIWLDLDAAIPRDALAICIEASLTYHLRRKVRA